jgi:two-component system sensor histidine kinase CreC
MKIRTRILLVFVTFIFTVVLGLIYLLAEEIRPRYFEAQEEALVDFSEMLAAHVSENAVTTNEKGDILISTLSLERAIDALPRRNLTAKIYELDKSQVDTRVYLTDRVGKVIFDSDNSRDLGKDYSSWIDVKRTLQGNYGARTTWADPIYPEGDTMYIARPVLYNGDIVGVLAVGKPTRNLDTFINNLTDNLWVSGVALAVIAALIGFMIYFWLTRPLDSLQRYALAVSRGERAKAPNIGNNEVGDVGKALESMRKALDGKQYIEEYVQTLTHELKAPVAGIRGASELLKEPLPDAKRDHFLDNIVTQTERIQGFIERLLDLAELESSNSLKTVETIGVKGLIEEVITLQKDLAESCGLTLTVHSDDIKLKGDPFLISQALTNLVKNAIEHASKGSEVAIKAEKIEKRIQISVTNQGEPIPDYAIDKLFDRFYSLPKANGSKGTGIGLSFVKEIAILHGGEAHIESTDSGVIAIILI